MVKLLHPEAEDELIGRVGIPVLAERRRHSEAVPRAEQGVGRLGRGVPEDVKGQTARAGCPRVRLEMDHEMVHFLSMRLLAERRDRSGGARCV
ncbi:MAG: hypothetical protein HZA66_00575 [Rhodopseudomonas palustris]|uniref:Uncharacterized protein n=1 Tax=Rhodopseudomonas palustris TaxID=1076 RepID=A0A933VYZ6_RHOPL|nr:hypothetical protein [Rhodopseudomonas palustris]